MYVYTHAHTHDIYMKWRKDKKNYNSLYYLLFITIQYFQLKLVYDQFLGPLAVESGFTPNSRTGFLELIAYARIPCSALAQRVNLGSASHDTPYFVDFPWEGPTLSDG